MSDTVKLIIEIPKEDYKKLVNPYQHNEIWCNRLKRMVMNGTLLDDVIAEIKGEISRKANSGQWSEATIFGFTKAVAIIDKHIGKESEE